MRYLFINSVYGVRSTGKLIAAKCKELTENGHECYVAYGREAVQDEYATLIQIGTAFDYTLHAAMSMTFDCHGMGSRVATQRFLRKAEKLKPDIIWLHNIHGYYLNYEVLFVWLRNHPEVEKRWTLHDCWALTGHCAYFTMKNCNKWLDQCENCPQLRTYPKCYFADNSKRNYNYKKKCFTSIQNMTLITPSAWLKDMVCLSFLNSYPVEVQYNTIDRTVFKPVQSAFKEKYDIAGKFMVLGVAVGWEETKGLQDMLQLRLLLDDRFAMVLVGIPHKKQRMMPSNIIAIEKTESQSELVDIYSAADVFVNPTHQDNYPTVNLEARACGTPVITYNVGGSPESAGHEYVVRENDVQGIKQYILEICKTEE